MEDYRKLAKRYTIYTVTLVLLFILGAIISEEKSFFLGLLLGTSVSLVNLWATYFQVKRLGEAVESGRAKTSVGTLFRTILALVAVFISYKFPEVFYITSVVIGLMITYIIILIDPIFQLKHLRRQ